MEKEDRNFNERLKLSSDALFWNRLANDSYFQFRNYLIVLSTILLPLTASIVVVSKASSLVIEFLDKVILVLGWLFLGVSIIFGLIQTWIDTGFFVGLSGDSSLREHLRKNLDVDTADKVIGLLPSAKSKSEHWALIFQTLFLFGGVILIMLVAVRMLFRM